MKWEFLPLEAEKRNAAEYEASNDSRDEATSETERMRRIDGTQKKN
jgi:hypothetical protein